MVNQIVCLGTCLKYKICRDYVIRNEDMTLSENFHKASTIPFPSSALQHKYITLHHSLTYSLSLSWMVYVSFTHISTYLITQHSLTHWIIHIHTVCTCSVHDIVSLCCGWNSVISMVTEELSSWILYSELGFLQTVWSGRSLVMETSQR